MGGVDRADHPRLPRRDALKVLPADLSAEPDYRARFNREAGRAASLLKAEGGGDLGQPSYRT